jgi:hypothetical protein
LVASTPVTVTGVGLVTLFVFIVVMMSPTYSSAQTIVSVSKEFQTPGIELNESTVKGDDSSDNETKSERQVGVQDKIPCGPVFCPIPPFVSDSSEPQVQENDTGSEEQPKTATTIPRKKVEGGLDLDTPGIQLPYKVKVKFDSITIHDDKEGRFSGDGEFALSAYVQGKRVDLTAASGIWDAREGKTYLFNPGTEVTVDLPETVPLSIFTVSAEVDCCPLIWPADDSDANKALVNKLLDPKVLDKNAIIYYIQYFRYEKVVSPSVDAAGDPIFNFNDEIGDLQVFYDAPDYGAGSHEEKPEFQFGCCSMPPTKEVINGAYTLRYTISVTAPPPPPPPTVKPEEGCKDNSLPISGVTSSGFQSSFPPNNAIDNNLNTKWWSTVMVDPFITLDLGSSKSVCGVDIAWADGVRPYPYRFDISASTDGTSFTKVFSGTSSGTTSSPEKYSIPLTQARYVKITITESTLGATRSIAEISEIDIFG